MTTSNYTRTQPRSPDHADKVEAIPGADPRFTTRRTLSGYAYAANGNIHNPSPRFTWHLLLDGRLVDTATRREPLRDAARAANAVSEYSA